VRAHLVHEFCQLTASYLNDLLFRLRLPCAPDPRLELLAASLPHYAANFTTDPTAGKAKAPTVSFPGEDLMATIDLLRQAELAWDPHLTELVQSFPFIGTMLIQTHFFSSMM
jgi:hypothetical protein